MIAFKDGFIGVTNNKYDSSIDFLHTNDSTFSHRVYRKCTPGDIKFFDFRKKGETISLLSARDGEFFSDSIDI